jgi:hypothetical protein
MDIICTDLVDMIKQDEILKKSALKGVNMLKSKSDGKLPDWLADGQEIPQECIVLEGGLASKKPNLAVELTRSYTFTGKWTDDTFNEIVIIINDGSDEFSEKQPDLKENGQTKRLKIN